MPPPPAHDQPALDQPALIGGRGILRDRTLDEPAPARGFLDHWGALVLFALVLLALRLAYLKWFCPYDLAFDEAFYWEWSRRLGWSYYTKGPGIAYLIAASTALFGDSEFGARVPAAIANAVSTIAIGALAADVARTRIGMHWRTGLFAAALFQLAPIYQVTGLLATIDGPYVACWAVSAWAAFRAFERCGRWAWLVLGAAIGIGFLIKYTILLLPPGLLLYAGVRRARLNTAPRAFQLAFGAIVIALAFSIPVLVWNGLQGWPTLRHLAGHLGLSMGDVAPKKDSEGWNPLWTLEFIGMQIGMVGPPLVAGIAAIVWAARADEAGREPGHAAGNLFLICCALPIIVFYLAVTLVTDAEGNWAMAGYTTLIALGGGYVAHAMRVWRPAIRQWNDTPKANRPKKPGSLGQILWHVSLWYGLIAGIAMLRIDWVGWIPAVPVERLMAAKVMGADADRHVTALAEETGLEPFVIAQQYGRSAQLAYYMPSRPQTLCSCSLMGGRTTDYDFWDDTDLSNPALLGRPALVVGGADETGGKWLTLFERVELIGDLAGEHKVGRLAFRAYGYTGPAQGADRVAPLEPAP